ncbi:MAG: hypothetical protein GY856_11565, partial [bacterium]|nr:hypothetical protein [bacterium]
RISLALRARGPWTVAGLRGVLGALLVRDPDQDEVFQRCFERFFTPQPELRTPASDIDLERVLNDLAVLAREPLARRPEETPRPRATQVDAVPRRRRLISVGVRSLAAILIASGLALLLWTFWLRHEPVVEPGTPEARVATSADSGARDDEIASGQAEPQAEQLPVVEEVPLPKAWQLPATLSTILLLGILGHVFWLRRARRPPVDEAPIPDLQAPRLFRTNTIGGPPEARLDRETLDQLADALGYFCSNQLSDALDVSSSIEATGRRGGIPELVFTPARQVRRVLILEDALAEPLAWNPTAGELARGLARRGIPVLYGSFHGVPDSFHTADGVGYQLEDLEDERRGYLLLIFSDGKGLVRHRDSFVLEALARWPQVAWMELRERRAWDEQSALPARFGLPVYPAGRAGL